MKGLLTYTLLIIALSAWSQNRGADLPAYPPGTREIILSPDGGYHFLHPVKPKQTIYSISKVYNVSIKALIKENPHLQSKLLSVNDTLRIPLAVSEIRTHSRDTADRLKLYYIVKPKETLYRIAKHYFRVPVQKLLRLNRLESPALSIGQHLVIGYLPVGENTGPGGASPMHKAIPSMRYDTLYADSLTYDALAETYWQSPVLEERGVAIWSKDYPRTHQYLAMHKHARINSMIEITNPMFGRSVRAKVVGHIPGHRFTPEVILVVSPEVARDLGVLDQRFYVHLKYVE